MRALEAELGRALSAQEAQRLETLHGKFFAQHQERIEPFAQAREIFDDLRAGRYKHAIATSSKREEAEPLLRKLGIASDLPVITREDAEQPKPDPALFLAAAARLHEDPANVIVVGDSVWDMLAARRAHALGVGVLTGGYAESELTAAGAYRVYQNPAQLRSLWHEIGVRADDKEQ